MAQSFQDQEQLREARKLRELFKGRFSDQESLELLKQHDSLTDAIDFVLKGDAGEVRKFIMDRNNALVENLRRDSHYVQTALAQGVETSTHLFACGPCDRYWWRRVPARKQVSKCTYCKTKYEPVPRDQEWGLAKFECDCGNVFWGAGWMNHTESPCYRCRRPVYPQEIVPPVGRKLQKTVQQQHSCSAPNCYNRAHSHRPHDSVCPHEQSIRKKRVMYPSAEHASSGSTVTTFMSQGELAEDYVDLPSLPGVPEVDED